MGANYDINYDDKRFTEVETDKKTALTDLEKTYGGMIDQSDAYYNAQIDASKQWAETQKKNQQAQTDFAIEQIEQQKDQAQKDYTKEQSGAYVDWQKQSNQYGANAEQRAAQGMTGTGYSESAQVSYFNTYQNRVTAARESFTRIILNYNNAIKDARLQNSAALAEIAFQAQQQQLELALQGFQYKNQLLLAKAEEKRNVENTYYQRYQDVLKQINTENALAEEVRQYNENLALEKAALKLQQDKFAYEKEQDAKAEAAAKAAASAARWSSRTSGAAKGASRKKSSSGSSGSASITKSSSGSSSSSKSNSGSKGSGPDVDMSSVLALGFGPISASRLNELVKSGVVEEYESGGKLKYRKSASTLKQSKLFGRG